MTVKLDFLVNIHDVIRLIGLLLLMLDQLYYYEMSYCYLCLSSLHYY